MVTIPGFLCLSICSWYSNNVYREAPRWASRPKPENLLIYCILDLLYRRKPVKLTSSSSSKMYSKYLKVVWQQLNLDSLFAICWVMCPCKSFMHNPIVSVCIYFLLCIFIWFSMYERIHVDSIESGRQRNPEKDVKSSPRSLFNY